MVKKEYKKRSIHFIGLKKINEWTFKCYTIVAEDKSLSKEKIDAILSRVPEWMTDTETTEFENYKVGVIIIHVGREACFAILFWWINENMLQLYAYLYNEDMESDYELISQKGIVSCVWELEVIWFERNSWIEEVMMHQYTIQSIENYHNKFLNNE